MLLGILIFALSKQIKGMATTVKNFFDKVNGLRAKAEIIGDKVWVKWFAIGSNQEIEDLDEFAKFDHMPLYVRIDDYCEKNGLTLWSY